MTRAQSGGVRALAATLFLCIAAPTWGASTSVLRIASNTDGEIELDARRVTIMEVLHALAAEGGFDVLIAAAGVRPLVNTTVQMAPLEYVLRQILRGRNHALVYDAAAALSQVILLAPSTPQKPVRASRAKPRRTPRQGPIVVSR
jgi:hypothetical protein